MKIKSAPRDLPMFKNFSFLLEKRFQTKLLLNFFINLFFFLNYQM